MFIISLKLLDTKEKYVTDFKNSYKKWYHEHGEQELDINDEELVLYFINKSYADMMPRTFRRIKSNAKINKQDKDNVLEYLKVEVMRYLKSNKVTSFNDWHKEVCDNFVQKFNEEVLQDKYKHMKFGKAQKIVNMMFKYLATCDNTYEYEERFTECHMPIDSVILDWYYRVVSPEPVKSRRLKWSNMSYEEYYVIQEKIKAYFESKGLNPFVEEWQIWEEEKK